MAPSLDQHGEGANLPMTLDEYQRAATETAIYPGKYGMLGKVYCALKLNGEAGEVAEEIGKALRDDDQTITDARRARLLLELGDVLWYLANEAVELGFTLSEVAQANIEKLARRKAEGKLGGSGSDR